MVDPDGPTVHRASMGWMVGAGRGLPPPRPDPAPTAHCSPEWSWRQRSRSSSRVHSAEEQGASCCAASRCAAGNARDAATTSRGPHDRVCELQTDAGGVGTGRRLLARARGGPTRPARPVQVRGLCGRPADLPRGHPAAHWAQAGQDSLVLADPHSLDGRARAALARMSIALMDPELRPWLFRVMPRTRLPAAVVVLTAVLPFVLGADLTEASRARKKLGSRGRSAPGRVAMRVSHHRHPAPEAE